ncbi:F-box protein cpr30 [Phtheirospermum japonicum]|uniref:F-box protein cpr30 n=1 Tax=Phtheirospermum japonicum TaxID=374723 RepID=A0A830CG02_9LAMI|nr:F-box protein cpr30 [Phtheirospermum japonicum]
MRSEGVYLNGALHWRSWDMVVALDLATGKYRRLPLPMARTRLPIDVRLDALGGCLVLGDAYATQRAWVLRGYGTEVPFWVELFSPKERSAVGASGSMWPVAYSDSHRQLILQRDNKIIRWDIQKYSSKKVTIDGLPAFVTSQVVPGSLFRLNAGGSMAAAGVKRKRSKSTNR